MEILSAIVQLLGGLALFLYGIELMGDGLKNSSGAALKQRAGKGHRQCCDGRSHGRAGHRRDPKLHRYHRS